MLYPARLTLQGRHVRAARALLGWKQADLARKAHISKGTIKRIEAEDGQVPVYYDTAKRIIRTFEKAGVEFLDEDMPGVRLKLPKNKHNRA